MAIYTRQSAFVDGTPADGGQVRSELDNLALATNNIVSAQITDGTIATADLANSAVTTLKTTASSVSVYKSSAQSITAGSFQAITFDTEDHDTDAYHDTSSNTHRLTVPTGFGGKFYIWGRVSFDASTATERFARIVKGGVTVIGKASAHPVQTAGNETAINVVTCVSLVAGDYVALEAYTGTTLNARSSIQDTAFGMFRLGS